MALTDDEFSQAIVGQNQSRNQQRDNELDPELTGCGASACCNPSHSVHRFIALFFMCFLGFGSYFCYDNPVALEKDIEGGLNLSHTQFMLLYSIYSWPNVILCFIGGFLIDRVFGIRMGTIIYLFILLIGQVLFATGAIMNAYALMVVGRFVFGIGAESLAVAQNNYAVVWFKGKELNMVFGLQLSFARVGSSVNMVSMQPLYKYVSKFYHGYQAVGVTLLLAGLTCVMSFMCALILGCMDKRAQRILRRQEGSGNSEVAKLSDIFTFKLPFWMVTIICVAYYVAIFPFIASGQQFFQNKYHMTPSEANLANSIIYIIAAVASPTFGFIVDKVGRNVVFIFTAIVATIGAHFILAFTQLNPYVGTVLMGLAYSMLASSLWPLVTLIIPEYQLGTAYGICQSIQNLGLAVITILAGLIVDHSHGSYVWVELFYLCWLAIALLATIVIFIYDRAIGGIMNLTPKERKELADIAEANATKALTGSDSVEDINPNDMPSNLESPVLRSRYLNRVGVVMGESNSDQEPLLGN